MNQNRSRDRAFTARTTSKVLLAGLCITVLLAAFLGPTDIAIGIALSLVAHLGILHLAQAYDACDVALLKNLIRDPTSAENR